MSLLSLFSIKKIKRDMTKVYQLRRRYAAYFETLYCGVSVPLVFNASLGNSGENRAELTTSDRFTQDAIEHDPRFGREFFLVETFGEPEPEPQPEEQAPVEEQKKAPAKKTTKKAAKASKEFANINDALYYLEEELGADTEGKDIEALLKENNIVIK